MTFYYLSQILQPWILPPGLNLIIAIAGHIISRFFKRTGNGLIWLAFISFWLFSTPIAAQFLIDLLQNQYPRLIPSKIKNSEHAAIVVLGGGSWVNKNAKNGYILSPPTKNRLAYAAVLYRHTHFPILVSGGSNDKSVSPGAILLKRAMWDHFKVPVAWQENKSINTMDEAHFSLPILEKNNIKTIYLVTNAWHMPRSMYSFQQAFRKSNIKIIAAPMGYITLQLTPGIINYIPSFNGLQVSQTAMHEYTGIAGYFFFNRLMDEK